MEEKKKAPEPVPAGDVSDAEMIEKMEATTARLEAASKKLGVERAAMEEARATAMLGGMASAGVPAEKPKEETAREYALRIARGELNEQERAARYNA